MKDAFSPVAVMVDLWDPVVVAGQRLEVPAWVINDLPHPVTVRVGVEMVSRGQALTVIGEEARIPPLKRDEQMFSMALPAEPGKVEIRARMEIGGEKKTIQSQRIVTVRPMEMD